MQILQESENIVPLEIKFFSKFLYFLLFSFLIVLLFCNQPYLMYIYYNMNNINKMN